MTWQKILEVFWKIYLNIFFLILLWILTSLVIWSFNITVSTTLKYCYNKALNKKVKLMGGAMKSFLKKSLAHEIFNKNFEKLVKPSGSSPLPLLCYRLNVRSLILRNFSKFPNQNMSKMFPILRYYVWYYVSKSAHQ